jgi:hypothetical protein
MKTSTLFSELKIEPHNPGMSTGTQWGATRGRVAGRAGIGTPIKL